MCLNSPFLIWVPCTSIYSQTVMYYTSFGYLNVLITYYWNSMANLYHTALCHQLYLFSDIAILLSSYPPELAYFEIRITFFACVPKICWLHSVLPTLSFFAQKYIWLHFIQNENCHNLMVYFAKKNHFSVVKSQFAKKCAYFRSWKLPKLPNCWLKNSLK